MSDTDVAEGQPVAWPSINDAPPVEEGGPIARKGFTYQDEIAVSFLLTMLENSALLRVHCETHDDLVLVWLPEGQSDECAEYVQVKAGEPDKLWSTADLCRKPTKTTLSIFEASLARDRHREIASFRLVTLRPVVEALLPLTYDCGSEARALVAAELATLRDEINGKFPNLVSAKGNGCQYWLDNCRWDVRYDLTTVKNENRRRLLQLSNQAGLPLLYEQIDQLLDEMRAWAKAAGDAKWVPDKAKKIITRAQILVWWQSKLSEIADANATASGGKLAAKMTAADLPDELVLLAVDLRREYAAEVRTPRYMQADSIGQMQARVKSEALTLRSRFVAGELDLSGAAFHALCLVKMDEISAAPDTPHGAAAFLKGCLYDIADRCLLRFERPTK